jgi:16S rRNA (cytosine967-C5)-methyltransferase
MNARQVVTRRVAARASRFPDFDLRPLDTGALDRRDAALARAIDQGVARQWLALVVVLESRLTRAWSSLEPKVAAALLVGAAQLLLLERLPDHAVIHEAVEWAKMNAGPKAGGLVNAVLRRVSELRLELIPPPPAPPEGHAACRRRDELPRPDGSVWRLREAVFADDPWRRLAQQTSHPQALLVRWLQQFGEGQTRSLAAHSLVQAPIILSGLDSQGGTPPNCTPHDEPGCLVFAGDHTELTALLGAHPGARVQDPAAAAAMQATERLRPPPRLIIDFCAGQGTKTQQLAQLHPEARIIATDKRERSLPATIASRFGRLIACAMIWPTGRIWWSWMFPAPTPACWPGGWKRSTASATTGSTAWSTSSARSSPIRSRSWASPAGCSMRRAAWRSARTNSRRSGSPGGIGCR